MGSLGHSVYDAAEQALSGELGWLLELMADRQYYTLGHIPQSLK